MNSSLNGRHKATAVVICVLVHCMLLIGIIIIEFHDPVHEPIILIADQEQQDALDAHTPLTQEQWVAMNNSLPNAQFMHMPTQAEQEPSAAPPEMVAQEEPQTPDQIEVAEQGNQPKERLIEDSIDEVIELATQFIQEQTEPHKEKPPIQEKLPKKPIPQKMSPERSEITLAQIAQGFVSQIKQEAPMAVDSNVQGQASMQQLQQLHYCQKIIGCIVNSYKINRHGAPGIRQENRMSIHLAINKDGTINTLRIVQSSGSAPLDQFVLGMFKDASSSFPPLPQTFKAVPFHLPFFNIDHLESFQTTQGWYIDSRRS